MKLILVAALAVFCLSAAAQGQEKAQAYTGASIITITGEVIPDGVMVVQRGKIIAIGPAKSTSIPSGTERHKLSGRVIMPGLIDTHSHIGGGSGGDGSAPLQPDVRILDSINVQDTGLQKAQAGGITTVNVMPGSSHLMSGQTLYLKLRDGKIIDDLLIRDAQGSIAGGMKMANGTNSRRASPFPETRAKAVALAREQYVKAQDYREKIRRANQDPEKMPPRDFNMEALIEILEGKRVVHFHTHRHDDIVSALRIAKEFGFKIVLHHVSEGWKVANEISASGAPASIIMIDSPGGKLEAIDFDTRNGLMLEKAGVLVGFHTDDPITDSRLFLRSAALAVRAGMSREKALYGLTMAGAIMLGLQDRVGSLEVGKDADFIVLSGDPLSVYTKVLETHVDGLKVFDRKNPQDLLYAVGGYGASRSQSSQVHDLDGEGE
jgi:imidazolonepropionase-like amidohydrolase